MMIAIRQAKKTSALDLRVGGSSRMAARLF
jgi:hypothetical protein